MQPIPKNSAQEFFKTLFIKTAVATRDVLINQDLIVTSLIFFNFKNEWMAIVAIIIIPP